MLTLVKKSLDFMTLNERFWWLALSGSRSVLAVLDLAGILAIGWVGASTALFLAEGSDANREISLGIFTLPTATAANLPIIAASILVLFLVKAGLALLFTRQLAMLVARVEARSAKVATEIIFGSNLDQARLRTREEITYVVQTGTASAFTGLLNSASTIVAELALFVLVLVGFLLVSPVATLVALVYFGAVALLIHFSFSKLMMRTGEQLLSGYIGANTAVGDLISVFRELSVSGKKAKFIDRVHQGRVVASENSAKQSYILGLPRHIIEIALLVGVTLFLLAELAVGDVSGSLGRLGVFLSGGFRLTAAMLPLQSALMTIKGLAPHAQSAHEILDMKFLNGNQTSLDDTLDEAENRSVISDPLGVEISDVSYTYPGSEEYSLDRLSLVIAPGAQVAFIGQSGAGKSTIADLLCGIIKPNKGTLNFKLPTGASVDRQSVSLGYVPQEPGLVSGTIAQNVALGVEDSAIDKSLIEDCLEKAYLGKVIQKLPFGIETDVGKYKDNLSGGEIQRLGLARALYLKPNLLVLDEATSALDAESESEIYKAIDDLRGVITVVLIAHRLNSVQRSDVVHLIDGGRVVDSGGFKDLVSRNSIIQRMVNLMRID